MSLLPGLLCVVLATSWCHAFGESEMLRFEVTWRGNKAAHGDIRMTRESDLNKVVVQAVSDGYLKALIEVWSRVQAQFTAGTMEPRWYQFVLKSNRLAEEVVDLKFDHKKKLVRVDKLKGDEREVHSEQFTRIYDPVTAIYLLRSQRDLTKPMFVDIYDGKDRARLFVNPAGHETVKIKAGSHPAFRLNLRLVKLTGDKKELGKGQLWLSTDPRRVPLLLTSEPVVGQVRFELVHSPM
ncbi:MAG: DUF3108 domain-containing protein [Thermodesulfobacteriota bacterium]